MKFLRVFLMFCLISSFQLKASADTPMRIMKREPGRFLAPHIKMAIEHVGRYTKKELKRIAPKVTGSVLSARRRSYHHAIKYYHFLLAKYYEVEYTGASADDQPLTNGVFRHVMDAIREQADLKDEKEDIMRAIVVGLGIAAIAA